MQAQKRLLEKEGIVFEENGSIDIEKYGIFRQKNS